MSILKKIKSYFPKISSVKKGATKRSGITLMEIRELLRILEIRSLKETRPNPLNLFAQKCFSQTDEDGITLEILRRINCLDKGIFAEFGVGDGTENNTLILKALGWRGFWVGGGDLAFKINQPKEIFSYFKAWVTLDNIINLTKQGMSHLRTNKIDVISLDLDGNDIYFVEALLNEGIAPKLFIVEYNPKLPPPIRWKIEYDAQHIWNNDDYFGASLASYDDLFKRYSYQLVCCNSATGSNAFFVKNAFLDQFKDVPKNINEIYIPARHLVTKSSISLKLISKLFS
jgi:hypothetical protein